MLCQTLDISKSGYYAWETRPASTHEREDATLSAFIQQLFLEHRHVYGSPRIHALLAMQGIHCGRKRVVRLMQSLGLSALPRCSRHPMSTKSDPTARFAPNLKWVTDCTMIATQEGWLYLAVVLDLFSRRMVGWAMAATENEELVTLAL